MKELYTAAKRTLPICKDEILKLIEETNINPDEMKIAILKHKNKEHSKRHEEAWSWGKMAI